MTTTYTRRRTPCSRCGRAVTRVRTYPDRKRSVHGELQQDSARHADRAVSGDRVDEDCNWSDR